MTTVQLNGIDYTLEYASLYVQAQIWSQYTWTAPDGTVTRLMGALDWSLVDVLSVCPPTRIKGYVFRLNSGPNGHTCKLYAAYVCSYSVENEKSGLLAKLGDTWSHVRLGVSTNKNTDIVSDDLVTKVPDGTAWTLCITHRLPTEFEIVRRAVVAGRWEPRYQQWIERLCQAHAPTYIVDGNQPLLIDKLPDSDG